MGNDIGNVIREAFLAATGRSTGRAEIASWNNSLQYMERILADNEIPPDAGVAIEYHIPRSLKRIDFVLTGQDANNRDAAILVELKQWQHARATKKDGIVITEYKGGEQEAPHPSYQAWSYKCLLEDYNQTVRDENILLIPCAYLHNYRQDNVLTDAFYGTYTSNAPVFFKSDAEKLQAFIKAHIKKGDQRTILYRIEHGKIKPLVMRTQKGTRVGC